MPDPSANNAGMAIAAAPRLAIGRTGTFSLTRSPPSVRGFVAVRSSISSPALRLPLPFWPNVSSELMRTSPSRSIG